MDKEVYEFLKTHTKEEIESLINDGIEVVNDCVDLSRYQFFVILTYS